MTDHWEFSLGQDKYLFWKNVSSFRYEFQISMAYRYYRLQILEGDLRVASVSGRPVNVKPNHTGLMFHTFKNVDVVLDTLKECLDKSLSFSDIVASGDFSFPWYNLPEGFKIFKEDNIGEWAAHNESWLSLLLRGKGRSYKYQDNLHALYELAYDLSCYIVGAELNWGN